jgi:CRP-like cAMP-binding protein
MLADRWSCMRGMDETNALATLPASLRIQLHVAFNEKVFTRVPLFRDCEPKCIVALAERLRPIIAIPGEYIIREGTVGSAIYLISRGKLAVIQLIRTHKDSISKAPLATSAAPVTNTIATLSDHDFFGEASLVNESKTGASVRALTFCDVRAAHRDRSRPTPPLAQARATSDARISHARFASRRRSSCT